MKIKLFENFEVDLDTHYEIKQVDGNGDLEPFESGFDDFDDINPYDLKEVVEYFSKYENDVPSLLIYKVTETVVDTDEIEKIKLKLAAKKYNIR